jgi:non-ribosomal peptide synthetase component F
MAIQYKDYVVWEQHKAGAGLLKKAETYWLKQFSGEIPVLDLPLDYERQEERSYAGGIFRCEIDGEAYAGLRKMCLEEGATMFMLLYAMYTILLWKLSLQTDIVVGVPIAGRSHVELAGVVGMFVNTLALRSRPGAGKGFRQYLAEVKENVLSAFDHQEFDLEGLVEQIGKKLNWKEGRNPLFDVMFTMQNVEIPELKIPGLSLKGYGQRKPLAKFDLSLTGIELKDRVELGFVYSDDLFKPETIERFAGYYREITASVLKNPDIEPGDMQVSPDYLDVKAKIAQEVYGEFEL